MVLLQWQSIEIRRQRLHKTWQQILLAERMEEEERQYQRQLHRLKRKEQEQQEEKTREMAERAAAKHAEALVRERRKLRKESEARAEVERRRKAKVVRNDSQSDEEQPRELLKVRKTKAPKPIKKAKKPDKPKPAPLPKRITPIAVSAVRSQPQPQPETDESVTEEYPPELGGYDSPPPELPADDLLNMLSQDKGSDTDLDDEPSMTSLILPVAHNSPKKANGSPARTKKTSTPQKRFPRNKSGPSLDFNFTNAEAKRQAKAAALAEQAEEEDEEPEPMLSPSALTPKKHLKRRKEVMLERQAALNAAGGKSLMESVAPAAKTKLKPRANSTTVRSMEEEEDAVLPVKKKPANKVKAVIPPARAANAKRVETAKDKRGGKGEKMTIKQRLANAEMLARMNKMQEMNTPKVPLKKTKKTQMKATMKSLAAKRAEFRKILADAPTDEQRGLRRRQAVDETELNTSMNSNHSGKSGSDGNDSPRKQLALKRKRAKETPEEEDVTPTKKLQFLEITKRLAKSPMPRFLRTPTPRMSPIIPSALGRPPPRRTSPDAQGIGDLNTPKTTMAATPLTKAAAKDYATRRMSTGPTRAKKTVNANTFGIPAGGTGGGSAAAGGGGFSMFDAFVNSGAGGGIPRLKTSTKGSRDGSPTV
ncbi:hypothetical protein BBJ28_00009055 [Nothophytophthora sp. Chile5]|nr:hypothetical protein BBJ28_00009055 [Nothophytophthora sp. Chile5]